MTLEVHPEAIGTLVAIGALLFTALRQLIIWRLDPVRTHLPWVAITLVGIAFSVTRAVHLMSTDAGTAVAMIRLQFALGMLLPGLALATVEVVSGASVSRLAIGALLGAVPIQLLCVATPWLIDGTVEMHHDLLGHAYYGARTGWMTALVAPICVGVVVAMRARIRQIPVKVARLRRNVRIAVLVCVGCALHDTLVGAGAFPSIFLLEYAFVAFGVIAANFEARGDVIARGELESRYRHLADATREGVVLCGEDAILDANRAFSDLLGAAEGTLRGRALGALVIESDRPAFEQLLRAEPGPLEVTLRRPDRAPLVVSIKATPAPAGSHGTRVLLIRDVTGERELQARLTTADRLAAIGTLAAGTAHEINNPLTFVLANAELLRETVEELRPQLAPGTAASASELIGEIVAGGDRIRQVVQDLTALARDRRGEESAVDLVQTLDRCIGMASSQLRHHALVVKAYGPVPPVFASEGQLFQVFLNLIVNASQAIAEGHAEANEIRVSTSTVDGRAVVEIADTGSGIEPATLARIFEPYFTTKPIGRGTGLGLSISQGIIASLGGTIEVTSVVGQGSTFRLSLPAAEVVAPVVAVVPACAGAPEPPRRRVLIVDDEVSVARALARILAAHDVEIVHSGRAAFGRLQEQRYDLVLCDLMMPDVTGMELHAQLVAAGDAIVDRFVFMTGGVATQAARDFVDTLGPERCLKKPIPMAELRELVAARSAPGA